MKTNDDLILCMHPYATRLHRVKCIKLQQESNMIMAIMLIFPKQHKYIRLTTWNMVVYYSDHHNECDGISNHQPHHCLLKCLFRHRSKETSKLHITGLCAGNSLVPGEFPAQRASNPENASIWWRHHGMTIKFHRSPFCITSPLCGEVTSLVM